MCSLKKRLMISYVDELVDGHPAYISSNCHPVKALNLEPAGLSFHIAALKLSGYCKKEDAEIGDQSVCSDDKIHGSTPVFEFQSNNGKMKSSSSNKQQDHYALLGLGHLRFLATEEQIRKSYREAALRYHPDKQAVLLLAEKTLEAKQVKKSEIENHFKSIQEAYEVLMDPVKRRIFDSSDEFDDGIPIDCAPHDFYEVFGLAFMRNGRWSINLPVPSLGNEKTSIDEVDSFYNFWYNFKSWREFSHEDEFDLECAEGREHKRWMERQNAKLKEKLRREEHARIRALVDSAYKKDPRIQRRKEAERAEKKQKKEARYLAQKTQEEEARRIAEEEQRRKQEEDRRAAEDASNRRKLKEKEKRLLRKERARLRALSVHVVSAKLLGLSCSDVEDICMSFEVEQLRLLCDSLEGKVGVEVAQILNGALSRNDADATGQPGKSLHIMLNSSLERNGTALMLKIENPVNGCMKLENGR